MTNKVSSASTIDRDMAKHTFIIDTKIIEKNTGNELISSQVYSSNQKGMNRDDSRERLSSEKNCFHTDYSVRESRKSVRGLKDVSFLNLIKKGIL